MQNIEDFTGVVIESTSTSVYVEVNSDGLEVVIVQATPHGILMYIVKLVLLKLLILQ